VRKVYETTNIAYEYLKNITIFYCGSFD